MHFALLRPRSIQREVSGCDAVWWHQAVLSLGRNGDTIFALLEVKERNEIGANELCSNRAADERREFRGAERKVLLNLHDAQFIIPTFCLNRKDVLCASPVNADIDLVRFDLTDARNRRTQMALERITGYAGKDVDQSVIPDLR